MVSLYNVYTGTEPPRARPGPPRPSLASGGPPAAARCGGVTNPTTKHRDAVGRSEVQLGVCIAHPGLSPGPINRRLRRRAQELLFTAAQTFVRHSRSERDQGKPPWGTGTKALTSSLIRPAHLAYTSTRYTERQGGENGGGRVCEPVFLRKHFFLEAWSCQCVFFEH